MLHTARVRTPVKAPGPDTRMKISPYTRNSHDQQIKKKADRSRHKSSGIQKSQRNRENCSNYCSNKCNAHSFQKQIKKPVFSCGEKEAPVRMQESVQHISQSLRAGAGKIRRGKSYRTNNKYSGKKQNQQSGMFFFYPSFSANQRSQITAEIFNRAHG